MEYPYAIFEKSGAIYWLGMAKSDDDAWAIAFGWPHPHEVKKAKAKGMYCTVVRVTPKT